jgi:hypothetical protein
MTEFILATIKPKAASVIGKTYRAERVCERTNRVIRYTTQDFTIQEKEVFPSNNLAGYIYALHKYNTDDVFIENPKRLKEQGKVTLSDVIDALKEQEREEFPSGGIKFVVTKEVADELAHLVHEKKIDKKRHLISDNIIYPVKAVTEVVLPDIFDEKNDEEPIKSEKDLQKVMTGKSKKKEKVFAEDEEIG